MNIWWVKSRSIKKKTSQAYLRWYENRKPVTKKLEGMYKFTGRITPTQRKWNKTVELDVADILNKYKKDLSTGFFDIEKWEKKGRSFVACYYSLFQV